LAPFFCLKIQEIKVLNFIFAKLNFVELIFFK